MVRVMVVAVVLVVVGGEGKVVGWLVVVVEAWLWLCFRMW